MPWVFGDRGEGPAGAPRYRGKRVEVTVKVVDATGAPVAGVDVDAKANADEYAVAGMTDEEYEAWLLETADENDGEEEGGAEEEEEWTALEYETIETGRTDRDGVWIAKLKPDVSVVFHAKDGRGREGVSPTLYVYGEEIDEEPFEVTIEIAEIGVLVGTVVDGRGAPIGGAEVTLTSWSADDLDSQEIITGGGAIRTDADGRFRVELRASGAFDVEVHAKRFQPVVEQAVQVLPGRETAVSITMLPSAEIMGIVLDPAGEPVPAARVVVQGQPQPGSFVSFEALTDDDGRFVAEELAPGRYVVAASSEEWRPAEAWNVEAGSGQDVVLRLTRGGVIEGTVIADATLLEELRAVSGPARRAEGEELPHPEDEDEGAIPEGERIAFFGDVYLAHAGTDDELIPLATGVPRERIGETPSGAIDGRGRYFSQVRLDDAGRGGFVVRGLPPGTYAGTVMVGTAIASIGTLRVTESSTTRVAITLPDRSGGIVSGTVRSESGRPFREGTVFLYGGTLPAGMSALIRDGDRFEFSSIPPGEYMIHAVATVRGERGDGSDDEPAYAAARAVTVAGSTRTTVEVVLVRERNEPIVEPIEPGLDGDDWDEPGTGDDWGDLTADAGGMSDVTPEDLWAPDVWIEEIDGNLVVTWAPPAADGKRLFGGDRVVSIDGTVVSSMDAWEALELLYGAEGSICVIVADRPATGESVTAALPRTRPADEI